MTKLEVSIPKLELKKAKEVQDLIIQKINNDENKKKGVIKEEKVKKMEAELGYLRKKLARIALEIMDCQKENSFLKKFIKELEGRNQILLS